MSDGLVDGGEGIGVGKCWTSESHRLRLRGGEGERRPLRNAPGMDARLTLAERAGCELVVGRLGLDMGLFL